MASHQSRTLQLLLIAFGFSFVVVSAVRLIFGTNGFFIFAGLLAAGAITYSALCSDGLRLQTLGITVPNLLRGLGVAVATFGLCLLLGESLHALGWIRGPVLLLPGAWEGVAYLGVRGMAEELLFRGFLFTGLARLLDRGGLPWRAWLLSSALFALYHLPAALWIGLRGDALTMSIGLPLITSLVLLVPLYLLSRNLWLVIMMHGLAATLITPHLQAQPLLALAFVAVALLLGRLLLRSEGPLPLTYRVREITVGPGTSPRQRRVWHVI